MRIVDLIGRYRQSDIDLLFIDVLFASLMRTMFNDTIERGRPS